MDKREKLISYLEKRKELSSFMRRNFVIKNNVIINTIVEEKLYGYAPYIKCSGKISSKVENFLKSAIRLENIPYYSLNLNLIKYADSCNYNCSCKKIIDLFLYYEDSAKYFFKLYDEDPEYIADFVYRHILVPAISKNNSFESTMRDINDFINRISHSQKQKALSFYKKFLEKFEVDSLLRTYIITGNFDGQVYRYNYKHFSNLLEIIADMISKKLRNNTTAYHIEYHNLIYSGYLNAFIKRFDDEIACKLLDSCREIRYCFTNSSTEIDFRKKPKLLKYLIDENYRYNGHLTAYLDKYMCSSTTKILAQKYKEGKLSSIIIEYMFGPLSIFNRKYYLEFLLETNLDYNVLYAYICQGDFYDIIEEALIKKNVDFDMLKTAKALSRCPIGNSRIDALLIKFCEKYKSVPICITSRFGKDYVEKYTFSNVDKNYYLNDYTFLLDNEIEFSQIEVYELLYKYIKSNLNNGTKVNAYLFIKTYLLSKIKNPIIGEDVKLFLSPNLIMTIDYNTIDVFNDLLRFPELENFILEKFIPSIDANFCDRIDFEEMSNLASKNILISLVDRFLFLSKNNIITEFKPQIFLLLNNQHMVDSDVSNKVNYFLEKIYPMIINHTFHELFDLNNDIMVRRFIENKILLKYPLLYIIEDTDLMSCVINDVSYINILANRILDLDLGVIDNIMQYISCIPLDNQLLKNALITSIRSGKKIEDITLNFIKGLDDEIMISLIDNNENFASSIISLCEHNLDFKIQNEKLLIRILEIYANKKSLPLSNLIILKKYYGFEIVSVLRNDSFLKLANTEPYIIERFMNIYKVRMLDVKTTEYINYSLQQGIFAYNNIDILSAFNTVMALIQTNYSENTIDYIVNLLIDNVPNNLGNELNQLGDTKLLELYNEDKYAFLKELLILIKSNQYKYSSILGKITTHYIISERNKFAKIEINNNIFYNTNVKKDYDLENMRECLFFYLLKNKLSKLKDLFKEYSLKHEIQYENIDLVLNFLSSPKKYNLSQDERICLRDSIVSVKKIFRNIYSEYRLDLKYQSVIDNPKFLSKVKFKPIFPKRKIDFIEILKLVDMDVLVNNILKDDSEYNELLRLLEKYRFLDWHDVFMPSTYKLNINLENDYMYQFINDFHELYIANGKEEFARNLTPLKLLKCAVGCSIIDDYYKILLGNENVDIIIKNPGPNSSNTPPKQRLDKAITYYAKTVKNNEVTIPSFIEDFEFDDKRKMRVVVGNRTDSINLTHGERTGACMRIGGVGESLFRFCLLDKRGFHITFYDEKTNTYISRVSGFRNGNTVFLNQLRYSVCPDLFSSNDVVKIMRRVAEKLIDYSKDSTMPIDNVVASPDYALEKNKTIMLSQKDIGAGVYSGYRDVSAKAVLLATSNINKFKPKELILDGENQPIYTPVKFTSFVYENNEITEEVIERISSISMIKNLIANDYDITNIKCNPNITTNDFEYIILGDGFYVALTTSKNIISEYIHEDELSLKEYKEALIKVQEYSESKTKCI